MATITEAKCRICRRAGVKLFLKGVRCETAKCGVSKRNFPPGERHWRRGKPSEYGAQMREKQKVRNLYGVGERTFHGYYEKATKVKEATGVALLLLLERRLDNVLYRSCLAASRRQARELIAHKHVTVKGGRVSRAGYTVLSGDSIALDAKGLGIAKINAGEAAKARVIPGWLEVDPEAGKAMVKELPKREDIAEPISEQLIVELYGK
jgi:small subunit ribosomal protein S4